MENSHLLSGFWIPEQVWSLEPSLICTGTPSPHQCTPFLLPQQFSLPHFSSFLSFFFPWLCSLWDLSPMPRG